MADDYRNEILERKLLSIKKNVCWTQTSLCAVPSRMMCFQDYFKQREEIEKMDLESQVLIIGKYYLGYGPMQLAETALIPSFKSVDRKTFYAVSKLKNNILTS